MAVAYYCFVNFGWPPSRFNELKEQEKKLVTAFAVKAMESNKKAQEEAEKRGNH